MEEGYHTKIKFFLNGGKPKHDTEGP